MSVDFATILDALGSGRCILRQHKTTKQLELIKRLFDINSRNTNIEVDRVIEVPQHVFNKLEHFLHKLTIEGEPPPDQRKPGDGYRLGCKELKLDYITYDWWVLTK